MEPFLGSDRALRLWRAYQLEDADGRREMEAAVQVMVEKQMGITPLSPDQGLSLPQQDQAAGPFVLGQVIAGPRTLYPFGLREDEFIQHMAVFGRSGAGKTNTIALLIKELVRHKKPFMIFDWKRNYRDLLGGPEPVPLEVYTVGRPVRPLRFNPLIPPPGTDLKAWLKKLIEIVSNAYYLGEGVIFLLMEAIDHAYEEFGCYASAKPARYPCMSDVLKYLLETPVKGRKAMWMDSTLRAVQSLCFGQISDVINVSHNDSVADLLGKNVCLELNALGQSEKIFFIETLLVWIHHCRLLECERETFKHCIIIEEAHNILSTSAKETVVDILMREIRELGEAMILVDQHPSQISVPAIGNTYCTLALNMKHSKDLTCLADMMQVPKDNREVFSQLPMGRAVVKLQSRYTRPFQIQIPKVSLDKGSVTDTHLLQAYPADSTGFSQEEAKPPVGKKTEAVPAPGKVQAESPVRHLTEIEEMLLRDIMTHPLDGVVRRYGRIGISRRRGNHAKEGLITKKVIQTVDIATKTGKVVVLELTPDMRAACKRNGVAFPSFREGGAVHSYWKRELKAVLERNGWTVEEEKGIGAGQAVDLHAEKGVTRVAVEVETGDRGKDNVMKLLPYGYEWIVTFSVSDHVRDKTVRDIRLTGIHCNNLIYASPVNYEDRVRMLSAGNADPEPPAK